MREAIDDRNEQEVDEEKGKKKRKKEKKGSFLRELLILVPVSLGLALLIKTFVIQAFWIPSPSMENTLLEQDRVLVNKLVYLTRDIERGDIVVFSGEGSWDRNPDVASVDSGNPVSAALNWVGVLFGLVPGEKDYIKRVIGVGGDVVKCCDAQNRITVNGVPLDEGEYLFPGNVPSEKFFEVKVPEGRLWVMGDHRDLSQDARYHQEVGDPGAGTIPEDAVIGRAFVRMWPFARWGVLDIPKTFGQPGLKK
ncbi:signal peptidase I [Rhizohabitans arisaemae]|uniref:signal peptidase I n=1 Tax=Rhizohabitans arisaemae TaxID=2720610 RepID=UPI0031FE6497